MFNHQQCVVVICDICGTMDDCTDYIPHWDNEVDALESIVSFDCGWTIWKGSHWCPSCNPPCSDCTEGAHYFGDHEYGEAGCSECACGGYVLPEIPLK